MLLSKSEVGLYSVALCMWFKNKMTETSRKNHEKDTGRYNERTRGVKRVPWRAAAATGARYTSDPVQPPTTPCSRSSTVQSRFNRKKVQFLPVNPPTGSPDLSPSEPTLRSEHLSSTHAPVPAPPRSRNRGWGIAPKRRCRCRRSRRCVFGCSLLGERI
jgi:hypothetical protein